MNPLPSTDPIGKAEAAQLKQLEKELHPDPLPPDPILDDKPYENAGDLETKEGDLIGLKGRGQGNKNLEEKWPVAFKLNGVENHMANVLIQRKGYRKSEIFRMALRLLYRKEFPLYAIANRRRKVFAQGEGAQTLQQLCEIEGGKLVNVDGILKCHVKKGKMEYDIVL